MYWNKLWELARFINKIFYRRLKKFSHKHVSGIYKNNIIIVIRNVMRHLQYDFFDRHKVNTEEGYI